MKIAPASSVYMLGENFSGDPLKFVLKKINIRDATAFPGFCKQHDSDLFIDIDSKFELNETSICKQCLRSIRREIYEQRWKYLHLSSVVNELRNLAPTAYRIDPSICIVRQKRANQRIKLKILENVSRDIFHHCQSTGRLAHAVINLPSNPIAFSAVVDFGSLTDLLPEDFIFFLHIIPNGQESNLIIAYQKSTAAEINLREFIRIAGGLHSFVNDVIYRHRDRIVLSESYIDKIPCAERKFLCQSSMLGLKNAPNIIPSDWKLNEVHLSGLTGGSTRMPTP